MGHYLSVSISKMASSKEGSSEERFVSLLFVSHLIHGPPFWTNVIPTGIPLIDTACRYVWWSVTWHVQIHQCSLSSWYWILHAESLLWRVQAVLARWKLYPHIQGARRHCQGKQNMVQVSLFIPHHALLRNFPSIAIQQMLPAGLKTVSPPPKHVLLY